MRYCYGCGYPYSIGEQCPICSDSGYTEEPNSQTKKRPVLHEVDKYKFREESSYLVVYIEDKFWGVPQLEDAFRALIKENEQLKADLRGKDNEIDVLKWRVEYLNQFKPKDDSVAALGPIECKPKDLKALVERINAKAGKTIAVVVGSNPKTRRVQCIRCTQQNRKPCANNNKYELRACESFIPRTETNKIEED